MRAVTKIDIKSMWNSAHEQAFLNLQNSLENAARLAHPDEKKLVCLFTDASEKYWASVLS